jgi:hypothetical protein
MLRYRFLRTAAFALCVYGVLGLGVSVAMLVVGYSTFSQIAQLQRSLETQRAALVASLQTVSGTLRDTSSATTSFQTSIDQARGAADSASTLANTSAGTFRELAGAMNLQILGVQPLVGLTPQFTRGADQLQQLAISLGATRDALSGNSGEVRRIGTDLAQLQTQLDAIAKTLSQPGILGFGSEALLPFQVAFYGMCLLVILQSAFSIIAGIALYRFERAGLRRATTSVEGARDPVRAW